MFTRKLSAKEKQRFDDLLNKYELSEYLSLIEPHLEPCILFEITEPDDYQTIGTSRRCGWPDFPSDWEWPLSQQGQYLNFLCQINLAEIAAYQDVLPRKGILYFFVGGSGVDYEAAGQIRFYDGDPSLLKTFRLPDTVTANDYSMGFRPEFSEEEDSFLLHHYPRKLIFQPSLSVPFDNVRVLVDENDISLEERLSSKEMDNFIDFREELMYPPETKKPPPERFYCPTIHQHMFGYGYYQTSEPRDFGQNGCTGPFTGVELYSIWDHDEVFNTCLDANISFVVRQDELNHCNFSEVFVIVEG